jgi:hypothetical protein
MTTKPAARASTIQRRTDIVNGSLKWLPDYVPGWPAGPEPDDGASQNA